MPKADESQAQFDPVPALSEELGLGKNQVSSVVALLKGGATVPFIARYRKEATGGMDEVQIRAIEERHGYLLELEERRQTILEEIAKQGKLTPELGAQLRRARSKTELEDLYLPYKPKRRTRALIAKERGLEPLADRIWAQPTDGSPRREAEAFVDTDRGVADADAALAGARDICAERAAEHTAVRKTAREAFLGRGLIRVRKQKEHAKTATKFDAYADFVEPVGKIPSHRFLAIRRGEQEGVLEVDLELEEDLVPTIERLVGLQGRSPWARELGLAVADASERLLLPGIRTEVRVELKLGADRQAVQVFGQNLRELLLAPPFGPRAVLGVDPGQRTGAKCAVVADTGALVAHDVLYLVQGEAALERAKSTLCHLVRGNGVAAVAVGNGTHGRETEAFVRDTLRDAGMSTVLVVSVNEAGASVYSASEVAREEFPDLDLTVRGAISIARRLQDPLAELVKLDPKSIGVGQYQHDVHQPLLAKQLDAVVESCVNQVGVELNTASASLLSRVAGLGPSIAKRIVEHRAGHGSFASRRALLDVAGLGPRTFEQSAGFCRVRGGAHPLDASGVHPERYPLVERMARDLGVPVISLIGDAAAIARIDPKRYFADDVGAFTLSDILDELRKPGRDPRSTFEPPRFRDDVRSLEDIRPGMSLAGIVTNVTAFGAFVDVGVHQDGLVHVSQLADRFVRDPSEVVKVGDRIEVRVLEVDLVRRRISLSARKEPRPASPQPERRAREPAPPQAKFTNQPFSTLRRK
jgi:uncharacterized protein